MCDICDKGGQVLGPFLKPMSRLVHTEYFLAGRTSRDPREVLRDTMYAATVTGSPVQNACRLIKQYEPERPRLLRRGAGDPRARRRRDPGRRQPDRDPHRRRRARRAAHRDRGGHPGPRLRPRLRGRRDACQGRRHPRGVRAGGSGAGARRQRRRARQRRGRPARAERAQPAARVVLAHRPVGHAPRPGPGRQARRDPRRRGRLREHAPPRARRRRHDQRGRPPRVVRRRGRGSAQPRPGRPGDRRARARRPPRRRRRPRSRRTDWPSSACSPAAGRSWPCAWATRCCATGSASRWPTRTSSSKAPRTRSCSTDAGNGSASTTRSSAGSRTTPRRCPRASRWMPTRPPATSTSLRGPHYRGIQFHAESILTQHGADLIHGLAADLLT